MRRLKIVVDASALIVLCICIYAFLLGNGVFKGTFENDSIGWYFLAKGVFCAVSLYLSVRVLEVMKRMAGGDDR